MDAALNPPKFHGGKDGQSQQPNNQNPGQQAAQQAQEALQQAAQAQARAMQQARQAGLRPGQLPPPGEGTGEGAQFSGAPKPVKLPNPKEVDIEELAENWARLDPKDRQQVLDRMRAQWPESYRKAIEAFLATVGNLQGGQPVPPRK